MEVAAFPNVIGVQDSEDSDAPELLLRPTAFRALLSDLEQR
ncbi:hypothetical protein [Actinomadura geliboluensis]